MDNIVIENCVKRTNTFEGLDTVEITATIDGIEMSVPLDPANRHYAEIMRQVEAGELVIQDAES